MAVLSLQFRQQLSSPQPTHLAYQFWQNSNSKNTLLQCHSLAASDDDASSRLHSKNTYAALRALTRTYRVGLVFLFPGLLHFLLFSIFIVPLTLRWLLYNHWSHRHEILRLCRSRKKRTEKKVLSITLKIASNSLRQLGHFVISLPNGSNHKYTKNQKKLLERNVHHTP